MKPSRIIRIILYILAAVNWLVFFGMYYGSPAVVGALLSYFMVVSGIASIIGAIVTVVLLIMEKKKAGKSLVRDKVLLAAHVMYVLIYLFFAAAVISLGGGI